MKRFYTLAISERDGDTGLHRFLLDGRPVKTPERAPLAVPGEAVAAAIVAEWMAQGERIDAATMPVTGFANATIDRVLRDVDAFAHTITAYAESDLLCYRAGDPAELAEEQARHWEPLLDWARQRYDVTFAVTSGIMPVDQPATTVARLGAAVVALSPWVMAGFATIVSITGSLVGSLALIEDVLSADALWDAAHVDERWQERRWGEDAEATARMAIRRAQYDDAARWCALILTGHAI
ncbi:MAG: ATP12 family protein [Sphingobium sp.]